MKKELTNYQIMQACDTLTEAFATGEAANAYVPIKIGFSITKDISILRELSSEIEEARLKICRHYGELSEDGTEYNFREEDKDKVNQELADLLNMTQEVELRTVKLEDIEKLELKLSQMQALILIIEEEEAN